MAIAFDSSSNGAALPGSSLTYSHTCSGANRILFVGVDVFNPNTDDVTSVTYGGLAMTQIIKTNISVQRDYLYYLVNPPTGANNIVITKSTSVSIRSCSASYTGVKQSSQPDASASNTAASPVTSITKAITTIADNCWVVSFVFNDANVSTAGTGTTKRDSAASFHAIGDSNSAKTPAGSYSMQWTNGTANFSMVMASFSPHVKTGEFFSVL